MVRVSEAAYGGPLNCPASPLDFEPATSDSWPAAEGYRAFLLHITRLP